MYAEHNTGENELYDLDRDPFELDSRHAHPGHASVRAQLAARLQAAAKLRRFELPRPALARRGPRSISSLFRFYLS